jgi:hypothetical protein
MSHPLSVIGIVNIVVAFVISIASFIYALVTPDGQRKLVKYISGINYMTLTFLLTYRLASGCGNCFEMNVIISLFNMTVLALFIDAYAGLRKKHVNIKQRLGYKFKVLKR